MTSAEHNAWASFFVAQGVLAKRINRELEAKGVVPLDVYDVLLQLELAPNGRLKMSELAEAVLFSRSGLTRLADRLEQEGLIARVSCCNDRRAVFAELTEKGREERERAWPIYKEAIHREFAEKLEPGDAERIAAVFGGLCSRLGHAYCGCSDK